MIEWGHTERHALSVSAGALPPLPKGEARAARTYAGAGREKRD
nr:MAG TPA: hypothetical protein [Caudoviricetes sp.]